MHAAVKVAALVLFGSLCLEAEDLLQELKRRSSTDGLALVRWNGIPVFVITFDGQSQDFSGTRYLSSVWFSSTGDAVAWSHHSLGNSPALPCANPLIVEPSKSIAWQVPGSAVNISALGVSADGARVAFDGTYHPPGTSSLTKENMARWLKGLFIADSKNQPGLSDWSLLQHDIHKLVQRRQRLCV